MSDRPCNYCSFQKIKSRAKADKKKVTVLRDARWGMGGVNIYVHPPKVDVSKLSDGEDGERRQYFVAWFMELPSHCCC